MKKNKGPKVLLIDIETAPILASVWALFDQNVPLNQIEKDWHLLAFAAKWLGDKPSKTIYMDQRDAKNVQDDKKLLKKIRELLDEADVIVSQNGKKFDEKKINARLILNGIKQPSSYKHIDTCQIARRKFGFTSNKLEYLTSKLNTKYKKLKHKKFPGFELWKECLAGNKEAWNEMKTYNVHDVLSLEELYLKLQPWDNSVNFNLYRDDLDDGCNCGSNNFRKKGFAYTSISKFQRYECNDCGSQWSGRENLFSKEKKESLRRKI